MEPLSSLPPLHGHGEDGFLNGETAVGVMEPITKLFLLLNQPLPEQDENETNICPMPLHFDHFIKED